MSDFWIWLYDLALQSADAGTPVLYSSRIDGALIPMEGMAL